MKTVTKQETVEVTTYISDDGAIESTSLYEINNYERKKFLEQQLNNYTIRHIDPSIIDKTDILDSSFISNIFKVKNYDELISLIHILEEYYNVGIWNKVTKFKETNFTNTYFIFFKCSDDNAKDRLYIYTIDELIDMLNKQMEKITTALQELESINHN